MLLNITGRLAKSGLFGIRSTLNTLLQCQLHCLNRVMLDPWPSSRCNLLQGCFCSHAATSAIPAGPGLTEPA